MRFSLGGNAMSSDIITTRVEQEHISINLPCDSLTHTPHMTTRFVLKFNFIPVLIPPHHLHKPTNVFLANFFKWKMENKSRFYHDTVFKPLFRYIKILPAITTNQSEAQLMGS